MTNRFRAINWWKEICIEDRHLLSEKYFKQLDMNGRGVSSLTGREIEDIWQDEVDEQRKIIKDIIEWEQRTQRSPFDFGF